MNRVLKSNKTPFPIFVWIHGFIMFSLPAMESVGSDLHEKGIGAMRKNASNHVHLMKKMQITSTACYSCALTHLRNAAYRYFKFAATNNNKLCT